MQPISLGDLPRYALSNLIGRWQFPSAHAARPGLNKVFGYKDETEAKKHIKVYENDYNGGLYILEYEG